MTYMSASYRSVKIGVAALVVCAFAFACTKSTYEKNKAAFESDRAKFEAMLPQWSKLVPVKKDEFKELPVQPIAGFVENFLTMVKLSFVRRYFRMLERFSGST